MGRFHDGRSHLPTEEVTSGAASKHEPVMLDRVIDLMTPGIERGISTKGHSVVIDATLGMGGHSQAILERFPKATLIGIDRDPEALDIASNRLQQFGERFLTWHGTYDQVPEALQSHGLESMDAALFDLGVSSYQLDERERGFAYSYDAPLDMRMDSTAEVDAAHVVNTYAPADLRRVIRSYGEEKFADRIARTIVEERSKEPFKTTGALVEAIRSAVPAAAARTGGHPAKRTFQALRIEVNSELSVLENALPLAIERLSIGARMVVMSYHSLEDRITKKAFQRESVSRTPPDFPVEVEEYAPVTKVVTRGTEKPTEQELAQNPRSASAKVRAVEKIRESRSNG